MEEKETVVRLRGLPWSATASNILTFFEGCNIEKGEEGIHILKFPDGRLTGDAFVEFASDEEVKRGLARSKNYIGRRYINVFKVKRSEMKYALMKKEDCVPYVEDLPIVRLRGLPFSCSKEEVANFFTGLQIAPNGITFLTDHLGRCNGEGFVEFLSQESIPKGLTKHKQSIGHRYIEVFQSSISELQSSLARSIRYRSMMYPPAFKFGLPNSLIVRGPFNIQQKRLCYTNQFHNNIPNNRHFEDGFGRGYMGNVSYPVGQFLEGGVGRGKNLGHTSNFVPQPRFNNQPGPRPGGAKRPFIGGYRYKPHESVTGHSIHMRGLPYSATEEDIIDFFSPVSLANIKIQINTSGRPSGDADVDFESSDGVLEAMKRNRALMSKRYIELFLRPPSGNHTNYVSNSRLPNKVQF